MKDIKNIILSEDGKLSIQFDSNQPLFGIYSLLRDKDESFERVYLSTWRQNKGVGLPTNDMAHGTSIDFKY